MIAKGGFDLAVIDGRLPDMSGLALAELAANENIPVILMSGDAGTLLEFHRFGYQFLAKPFTLVALLSASSQVMNESRENILRVKASAAKMLANTNILRAELARSRKLLDESERKWRARGIVLKPMMHDDS
jgi:DNA-binding NtrC family response regulator